MQAVSFVLAAVAAPAPTFTTVSVSTSAPWTSDPVVEAAALIHDARGPTGLMRFWTLWVQKTTSEDACAGPSMRCAMRTLGHMELPLLELRAFGAALAARTEAPKVEAWAQLAATLGGDRSVAAWLAACGLHTDLGEALAELSETPSCARNRTQSVPSELDHDLWPLPADGGAVPTLTAYVDPHSPTFDAALVALRGVPASTARIQLRYRPAMGSEGVPIQGFGATIRIKASEYKVVDDRAGGEDDATEEGDDDGEAEAAADAAPSWLLRKRAGEPLQKASALSSEKQRALGMQAALAVLRSRRPLATLRDVSGSLPSLARALSRISLSSPTSQPAAQALEQQWPLLEAARNTLLVNGIRIDLERPDYVHAAARAVLAEAKAVSELVAAGVRPAAASQLMHMPSPSPQRLDTRAFSALWLSDLSVDSPFKTWPTDLSVAAKRGLRGAIQFTRHNLFSVVFAFDPATRGGAIIGAHAATLVKRSAPVRVGVLPLAAGGGPSSLGTRLLAHVHATGGKAALLALLRSLGDAAARASSKASGTGAAEGGGADDLLARADLVAALRTAMEAGSEAGKTGAKGKKKKAKKATAAPVDPEAEAASLAEAEAVLDQLIAPDEGAPPAGSSSAIVSIDPAALKVVEAMGAAAAGAGLPQTSPVALLNGLVIRARVELLGKAVAQELKREAARLRELIVNGALTLADATHTNATRLHDAIFEYYASQGELVQHFSADAQQAAHLDAVRQVLMAEASARAPVVEEEPLNASAAAAVITLERGLWARQLAASAGEPIAAGASTVEVAHSSPKRRLRLSPRLGSCAASASCIELAGEGDGNALHVVAIVEPLSAVAHKVAALLIALRASLRVRVTLLLAASPNSEPFEAESSSRLPLESFHSVAVQFDPLRATPPSASFDLVRGASQTLTLTPDAPAGWLMAVRAASEDLDNLQLHTLPPGQPVHATYSLSSLLVTGKCISGTAKGKGGKQKKKKKTQQDALLAAMMGGGSAEPSACTAAPLELHRTSLRPTDADTAVDDVAAAAADPAADPASETMVIGGDYYQLQGGPGLWNLRLASGEARLAPASSSSSTASGSDPAPALPMAIISYAGATADITIHSADAARGDGQRQPTRAARSLSAAKDDETVHVFSLASGLLYERFLRIMMKSASERSSRPLKFWLLGNFLSPAFRQSVQSGALAAAVGAEVAIVQYVWPAHLRYQTEKQRLIWGYKILFLDVLFPLHVRKVIYVDADQIVQGDLAQLWKRPLGGAPVAMTPFCRDDPNEKTTGFRFWEQGFWKGALGDKPYHISALFVADLDAFRSLRAGREGVGDVYRQTYQSLTADPNSLANLDQDLPNYLQSQVPIHSLPEEWLWCESWCGNASKATARTIDLCNNPLTKEPKLEQARRIGGDRWARIDAELEATLAGGPNAATLAATDKEEL